MAQKHLTRCSCCATRAHLCVVFCDFYRHLLLNCVLNMFSLKRGNEIKCCHGCIYKRHTGRWFTSSNCFAWKYVIRPTPIYRAYTTGWILWPISVMGQQAFEKTCAIKKKKDLSVTLNASQISTTILFKNTIWLFIPLWPAISKSLL